MADDTKRKNQEPVTIGRKYDPELDPESPEFNQEKYVAAVKEGQAATIDAIKATAEIIDKMNEDAAERFKHIIESISNHLISPDLTNVIIDLVTAALADMDELRPYLRTELTKPEYNGRTVDDLLNMSESDDPEERELFLKAWEAAEAARDADKEQGGKPGARDGKTLRTVARAGEVQRILTDKLLIPTDKDYLNAVGLLEEGRAYMTQVNLDGLKFSNGKLFFEGRTREISEMELQDLKTKEGIENINLPFLSFYYGQLFTKWVMAIKEQARGGEGKIDSIQKFYLPELAEARGLSRSVSPDSVEAIKKDIAAFHNIVGVLHEGYKTPSYYPVLNFEGYDSVTNTIAISSPYLLHVVEKIYSASVRRSADGTAKLRSDNTPQTRAVNSYLVHSDIQTERNKSAVQNVFIIVQGIERRGGSDGYKIKAETLISRNPQLSQQLANNQNKWRLLKSTFKKTWELLRTKTDLQKKYIDIKLPDPNDPANIPTLKGLKDFVITIPHKGKRKDPDAGN